MVKKIMSKTEKLLIKNIKTQTVINGRVNTELDKLHSLSWKNKDKLSNLTIFSFVSIVTLIIIAIFVSPSFIMLKGYEESCVNFDTVNQSEVVYSGLELDGFLLENYCRSNCANEGIGIENESKCFSTCMKREPFYYSYDRTFCTQFILSKPGE